MMNNEEPFAIFVKEDVMKDLREKTEYHIKQRELFIERGINHGQRARLRKKALPKKAIGINQIIPREVRL
jgi:hypothetical protein